jgi:membrane protein involved in colicin uptake
MATSKTKAAPPLKHIADKEPTALHEEFVAWLKTNTGVDCDLKSVQLATVLRMEFQRSEQNQKRLAASKKAKADADAAREARRAERAAGKKTAAAPTKKAAAPAAKKATGAPATKKAAAPVRRRAAKKATAGATESFE